MKYEMISADCHLDLCWLPPDLFTSRASAALKDRVPYTKEGPRGPVWVTNRGASLGMACGMGSAGREYIPGRVHRADRMASTGLYEDGKRGIRRITDPELRLKDQDRDGVQAEVLYGVLGTTGRMNDPEAAVEVLRIYNEWLADFCSTHPDRYAGLASIPNHPLDAAIAEVQRVVKRGALRGLDIANSADLKPLWDPYWNPLWDVIDGCGLPLHFHTVGGYTPDHIRKIIAIGSDPTRANTPDAPKVDLPVARSAFASNITQFQMNMSNILTSMIFSGVFERYPRMKLVLGESGIGWIPYVLWRMDAEWEDQFKDLSLTMPPSEYWKRQCWATYQTDPIGVKLLDELGADKGRQLLAHDLWRGVTKDEVERVVDHRFRPGSFMVIVNDGAQPLPPHLHRKRYDRRVPTARRGYGSGTEVVRCLATLPGLLIHVAVAIDAPGYDQLSDRIHCFFGRGQLVAKHRDASVPYADVGAEYVCRRRYRSVDDLQIELCHVVRPVGQVNPGSRPSSWVIASSKAGRPCATAEMQRRSADRSSSGRATLSE